LRFFLAGRQTAVVARKVIQTFRKRGGDTVNDRPSTIRMMNRRNGCYRMFAFNCSLVMAGFSPEP